MTARRLSVAAVVWWGLAAVIVVSVVLAPIRTVGWCASARGSAYGGGGPVCSELKESLVGLESTTWLWLAGLGAVVACTAIAALASARARRVTP